jgi:hypothetical protein
MSLGSLVSFRSFRLEHFKVCYFEDTENITCIPIAGLVKMQPGEPTLISYSDYGVTPSV